MKTTLVSAAAVLAIAGAAFAQSFNLRGTIDISDAPGIVGGNNINTNTSFYNNLGFGTLNGSPNPALFGIPGIGGPALEFDSYWAIDGLQANGQASPGTGTYQSAPQAGSPVGNVIQGNLAQYNAGFATPGVGSTSVNKNGPFGEGEYLFIGRLTTVGADSTLFNGATGGAVLGRFGIFNGGGNTNISLELNGGGQPLPFGGSLFFRANTFAADIPGVGAVVVNDLYLTNIIPTPGALALFGLAGAAATRRRRA